jgi:hypothetical protein
LQQQDLQNMTDEKPLLICVNPSKAGSHSLAQALRILGLDVIHFASDVFEGGLAKHKVLANLQNGAPPLSGVGSPDAVLDYPTQLFYQHVIENSSRPVRTVMLYRDPSAVALSFARMALIQNRDPAKYKGQSNDWPEDEMPWENFSYLHMVRRVEEIYDDVLNYFIDRPSLPFTILDIIGGDGWEPLCKFLGMEIPGEPFPHEFSLKNKI